MKPYFNWLILLLLISSVLYITPLDYGRPVPEYNPSTVQNAWLNGATVFHPDAFAYVGLPYSMMVQHTLNPRYYHNPSLNIYTNMVLFWVSGALGLPHHAEYGTREIAPFSLYVMAQFLSALFTLLTVALSYAAARTVFGSRIALVTAALVALSPLSVQHAHYATPNAETITVSTAALLLAFLIFKQRQPRPLLYAIGGALVGLTMAGRYNAVVVGLVTALAMVSAWWSHRRIGPVLIGLVAMPVGFVLGTPGSVFAFSTFITDVRTILDWYKVSGGGPGWTTDSGLFYHWRYTLLFVVGPGAAILAVWGLFLCLRHRQERWVAGVLVLYVLIYSLLALPGKRVNANLLLPLIFPLALFAARSAVGLWQQWGTRRWIGIALTAFLLIWPGLLSMRLVQIMVTPDTRMQAQAWIEQHISKGSTVHLLGSYNVPLDPLDYHTANTYDIGAALDDPLWNAQIIVYSDAMPYIVRRDPALTLNPADITGMEATAQKLRDNWTVLARFPRLYWPGQDTPPDDVSLWHQMEITVYCNPAACPAS